jgi:hypothetical protein
VASFAPDRGGGQRRARVRGVAVAGVVEARLVECQAGDHEQDEEAPAGELVGGQHLQKHRQHTEQDPIVAFRQDVGGQQHRGLRRLSGRQLERGQRGRRDEREGEQQRGERDELGEEQEGRRGRRGAHDAAHPVGLLAPSEFACEEERRHGRDELKGFDQGAEQGVGCGAGLDLRPEIGGRSRCAEQEQHCEREGEHGLAQLVECAELELDERGAAVDCGAARGGSGRLGGSVGGTASARAAPAGRWR